MRSRYRLPPRFVAGAGSREGDELAADCDVYQNRTVMQWLHRARIEREERPEGGDLVS